MKTINAVTLVLAGLDDRAWEINYFSIIDYKESGENTLLTLNGHLCNGMSFLLIALSLQSFESLYNNAKADVEYIQKTTFKALSEIQKHHDYFEWSGTDIKDYLSIHWTYPVLIELSSDRELPFEIRSELEEKFHMYI